VKEERGMLRQEERSQKMPVSHLLPEAQTLHWRLEREGVRTESNQWLQSIKGSLEKTWMISKMQLSRQSTIILPFAIFLLRLV
jgi:hypothetical protein